MTTKPHLSPTQLELYCKCGEAYRRRYIEGEKIPPGIAMLQGTAVHRGAQVNFSQKIETHRDLPARQIVEAAVAQFESSAGEGLSLTPEESERGLKRVVGSALDETVKLARIHADEAAPEYQPIAVERPARIVLPNSTHDLLGVIDLEDDQDRVVDFKTAKRRKNHAEAHASVQLTYYAAAHKVETGRDASGVRLDVLVKGKRPYRQVLDSTRGHADFAALANRVNVVLHGIQAGVFHPATPGAWFCSATWCGYHATCKFVAQHHGESDE